MSYLKLKNIICCLVQVRIKQSLGKKIAPTPDYVPKNDAELPRQPNSVDRKDMFDTDFWTYQLHVELPGLELTIDPIKRQHIFNNFDAVNIIIYRFARVDQSMPFMATDLPKQALDLIPVR